MAVSVPVPVVAALLGADPATVEVLGGEDTAVHAGDGRRVLHRAAGGPRRHRGAAGTRCHPGAGRHRRPVAGAGGRSRHRRAAYPPDVLAVVREVWEQRETWLAALDALPHGLAHQDAFRRNLVDRSGRTVALDWAFVGPAPVGAETAPLLVASVAFGEWPVDRWQDLDRAVRAGYLAGLREGGWTGDADLVALGHTASAVLRYVGTCGSSSRT